MEWVGLKLLDAWVAATWFLANPNARRMVVMVLLLATGMTLSAQAAQHPIAVSIGNMAGPYVFLAVRIVGATLAVAGLFMGIQGFTSEREGKEKIERIAIGLITLGVGVYLVSNASSVIKLLGIDSFITLAES